MPEPRRNYPVSEFSEHDDPAICELQRIVYPDNPVYADVSRGQLFWHWWFRGMPWKKSRVFGVTVEGAIAGVRPLSFLPVVIDGNEELCGILNATVTHPGFRKLGIFSRTLAHTLKVAEQEEHIRFAISFPNDSSYPLHLKNPAMTALCDLPLYIRIFNPQVLGRRLRLPGLICRSIICLMHRASHQGIPSGFQLQDVHGFDERFDRLWDRVKKNNRVWIARTAQYLNWRYAQAPLGGYEIVAAADTARKCVAGYIVVKTETRFGMRIGLILDLVADETISGLAETLVAEGIVRCRRKGADAAGCLMLAHHPYARALRANGMLRVPDRLAPRKFHVTVARFGTDEKLCRGIADARNWYLTLGDTDNV